MNRYYLLRGGVFKDGADELFQNRDTIYPLNKGDKIFYKDVEYTVIHIDYYFKDCGFSEIRGRFDHRKIYLRGQI